MNVLPTDLTSLLQQLAGKMGVTVEHLWPQLVALTFWWNLTWVILYPLMMLIFTIMAIVAVKGAQKRGWTHDPKPGYTEPSLDGAWAFVMAGVAILWLFLIFINLPGHIAATMAPEGQTVINLIKLATGKS